ncbi:MAG: hypothetical protein ACWA5T_09010 [Parvularcula sp.]
MIRRVGIGLAIAAAFVSTGQARSVAHDGFPPLSRAVLSDPDQTNEVGAASDALGIGDYSELLDQIPPARNLGPAWHLHATQWTAEDERGYQAFVKAIGRSGCTSIDDCLRSGANPYRDLDDDELWLGDCTDMVYILRGYYAWKRGLPFSFEDGITARQPSERGTDLRYTKGGNRITSRVGIVEDPRTGPRNAPRLLRRLFNIVSTAMLRTPADDVGRSITSFYPVTITRESVVPGIVAYDIYGHVSIVYDVTDDGRILLISSHPDYTVSREPFGSNIVRSSPELGSGLKAWRPVRLVGAVRGAKGTYLGGSIELSRNETLTDFSLEQYYGTEPDETGDWADGRFIHGGKTLPYYQFVQARLRAPGVPSDPLAEFAEATDAFCGAIRARGTAVNLAKYASLTQAPAPTRLPDNIYGTYGDWERYATPSRDARLKTQALELRQMAERLIQASNAEDADQAYVSDDMPAALLDVYDRRAKACTLIYSRSDDSKVRLTLKDVTDRLFDLSFDPFHCPEIRWGAKGTERETCPADPAKERWYRAQKYLRYSPERTYDLRTAFTADQLKDPAVASPDEGGIGRSVPPDVDVHGYLVRQAGAHSTANTNLPTEMIELSGAVNAGGD